MNFNYSFIKSISGRIVPTLKHGVEGFKHPNRIYFKPSDVPMEELAPAMEKATTKISEDATVAPFADRLIHPDIMGMKPAINGIKEVVNSTKGMIDNIKDDKTRGSFQKLYSMILDNKANIPKESNRLTSLMGSVDIIDNPKIKEEILKNIDYLTSKSPKKFKYSYDNTMSFAESYADAANSLNGKCMNIKNDAHEFYQWMDKNNVWMADVIDGTKKSETEYRNKLPGKLKAKKSYNSYLKAFDNYTKKGLPETYQNTLKQDALRYYFHVYSATRKEATKILYHEEYLKTLPADVAKECADVQNKYGTYIITSNKDTTPEDIKYIKEELRLWKEAGQDRAVLPKAVFVNSLDDYLLKESADGVALMPDEFIYFKELLNRDGKTNVSGSSLRHEIQHINDFDILPSLNPLVNIKNDIKWHYLKHTRGDKWDKELEKGGIFLKYHRKYGLSKKCELKSVTAEANPNKLSDNYKDEMHKTFHMQKWIFDLKRNSYIPEKVNETLERVTNEASKVNVGIFS